MQYLLTIAGVLALLVTGFFVGLFFLFKARLNRAYMYSLAAGINRFPARLRLRRQETFRWRKPDRAGKRVAAFHALGFEDVGGYSVDDAVSNMQMFVLRDPASGLIGIVNEADELGTWSDVVLFRQDGDQPILASNILSRRHFRFLPGDPRIHQPDASLEDLIQAVQRAAGLGATTRRVTADDFPARFERAFAEATDTRLLEPMEDHEIRRMVLDCGFACEKEISDKQLSAIKELLPQAIETEFRLACGAQFLRETTIPATEWERATGRLFVLHDQTPLRDLRKRWVQGAFLTKAMKRALRRTRKTESPREAFARLNATLPAGDRYKKLGEVQRPVPADIYRAPITKGTR